MLNIPKEIFRAYDIRGIVEETLTPDIVFQIGQAIGTHISLSNTSSSKEFSQIVIGRDGRLSGPDLNAALSKGLQSVGCDVIDIGMVPTPLLYFATHHLNIPNGVMITGSHNPPNYNGLKIILNGKSLYGESIEALYQTIVSKDKNKYTESNQEKFYKEGLYQEKNILSQYNETIQKIVSLKRPLKVVVDAGNGVTGEAAPKLFRALGCEVIPLFCEIDGHFPNHHPDPGQMKNLKDLQQAVLLHQADIGFAFDGDGDRLGIVDNKGQIILPDRALILFAKDILSRNPNAHIIFDVKCSRHVPSQIKKWGGEALMWKTGHSLIKAKMQETQSLLAGEMSGHFFFKERWFGFDDALYAGARLLEILSQQTAPSSTVFSNLPDSINTPELQISTTENKKFEYVQQFIERAQFRNGLESNLKESVCEEITVSTIDGIRVDFPDGFGLLRPSNTSPKLILRFEGDNEMALRRIQDAFRTHLLSINPDFDLPF